ncbi:MAG TPA: hypothetical protein VIJ36_14445 [Thermoanaerobaculia bacterium]
MKRVRTALVLAVACLCAACASRSAGGGGGGVCTVPAAICQANPATPAPGSPPTCGLCPADDLIQWIERKGCQYGPNLSCAQGQIYGYQGKSYCCQTPPYSSGAAPAGGTATPGASGSSLSAPGGSGERGGGKTGGASGGCPTGCTAPPPGCNIKGNINRKTGDRVYHLPGQKHYDEVTVEPEAGERWFCTEDEAQASGWRKSKQ